MKNLLFIALAKQTLRLILIVKFFWSETIGFFGRQVSCYPLYLLPCSVTSQEDAVPIRATQKNKAFQLAKKKIIR